jgi:type III pantothenate kinase
MTRAELLLIDNSNSFTKFALASREKVGPSRKIPTRTLDDDDLRTVLRGWKFQRVVMASVVPAMGDLIARYLAAAPLLRVSAACDLGIAVDYPKPRSIGADRLANAAAAAHEFGAPSVVVDFGTAVNFDIVSKDRAYIGGVIAPGLEAMTDYLHDRTALLPKIQLLEPPGPIGKSTKHAMLVGAVYGYRGLVREILQEIRRALGHPRRLRVVATGGYAELIAAGLPEIATVRPGLTLEGLRIIGNRNAPR